MTAPCGMNADTLNAIKNHKPAAILKLLYQWAGHLYDPFMTK
jgi:hypothetical protein